MGDIKLFQLHGGTAVELAGQSVALEKSLQNMMERNLETFLGIRFLVSEQSTGKRHNGRIDTLGIDENNSPVIIEYKRSMNENVINQGLFYLNWLLDHKADFELMVMRKYGQAASEAIDWRNSRLLCIAGSFTKYDIHAVQQIHHNIELYQYKHYSNGLLLLELVNASTAQVERQNKTGTTTHNKITKNKTVMGQASTDLNDTYETLKAYLVALGDDVQIATMKHYIAYKRIKNFACVKIYPQSNKILVYLKINPDTITLKTGFTRDMRGIGHYGTGDLEVTISNKSDMEKAKHLIDRSYDAS